MTVVNDGGPAFPQGHMDGPHVDPSGISVRDYFAGQALAGYLSDSNLNEMYESLAERCYKMADAMIAARDAR